MNEKAFKLSDEFDELLKKCLAKNNLSVSWIQKELGLSFPKAAVLYQEAKNYNDEVFLHNALYELSFLDEPVTITRIMNFFDVSYLLAQRIYGFYQENI